MLKINFWLSLAGLIIFLLLTHPIRTMNYATIPEPYLVLDEKTNILHGLSLKDTGVPAAWSDLRSYWEIWSNVKEEVEREGVGLSGFNVTVKDEKPSLSNIPPLAIYTGEFDFGRGKTHTLIVQPYLDHPPFGALVLSSFVSPSSKTIPDLTLTDFRRGSVALSYLTAILLFLLGYQMFKNPLPGLISAITFASAPTFVLTSRMALLENVLVPLQLLVLNLLFLKRPNLMILFLAGVVSGLAALTKTVGFAVIISSLIYLFLTHSTRKQILIYLIPSFIIGSLYFLWGMFLSPGFFMAVLQEQSTRRIFTGSLNFLQDFVKFGLSSFPLDGWWIGGFLSLAFLKNENSSLFFISFLTMLFTIFFTGASNFAWYVIPLVPFMCIGIGFLLWQIVQKPEPIQILLLFSIFFSSSFFWGYGVQFSAPNFNGHQAQFLLYKILISSFFLTAFLSPYFYLKYVQFKKVWIPAILVLIGFMVFLNLQSIIFLVESWGKVNQFYPNWQF